MDINKNEPGSMQINTGDKLSRGRFSNTMLVTHGPEEFMLDWLLQSPNGPHLVARVIVTPTHMKRIVKALQENVETYERNFGEIKIVEPKTTTTQ